MRRIYAYMLAMWGMMIGGGGVLVLALGPLNITGFGEFDGVISSVFKGAVTLVLLLLWISLLIKLKSVILTR